MSKIYVYTRVSTKDQSDALAQQDRVAMEEAKVAQIRHPRATEIIGPLADKASAFKIPFHQRPMGRLICESVQSGDIVIFSRLDRFVRMGKDFELQFEEWNKKGVTIIFADLKVDMSTAAGGMVARMFSAFAQYFSESLSERMKLSYRERYIHGTKYHSGHTLLVTKITRPGMPSLTIANRRTLVYLRFVAWRRRYSYLKNGVPDGWRTIADDLERARVAHGDIPHFRAPFERTTWHCGTIHRLLHTLLTSELPALNSERIVKAFREQINPFTLGRKKDGKAKGYKLPTRNRPSLVAHFRSLPPTAGSRPKRAKRWATQFDFCQVCGRSDFEHFSKGKCQRCYKLTETPAQRAASATQPTNENGQTASVV